MAAKLVCGVGVNDAGYQTQKYAGGRKNVKLIWICPVYKKWKSMITRCYFKPSRQLSDAYYGVYVCKEWHSFSSFRAWIVDYSERIGVDIASMDLDKDLIINGSNVYSPETCSLVTSITNRFILDKGSCRAGFLTGVAYAGKSKSGRVSARCSNPFTGKDEYLGRFDSELEAHHAWKKRKHELACKLAEMQHDERVSAALKIRYL